MKSLKMLTREWDVVFGVLLGTLTAPRFTVVVKGLVQGVGGQYSAALSSVLVAFAALLLVGKKWPGLAVAFAAVYLTQAAVEVVPQIAGRSS